MVVQYNSASTKSNLCLPLGPQTTNTHKLMLTYTACAVHDPNLTVIRHVHWHPERDPSPTFTHSPLKEALLSAAQWLINQIDSEGEWRCGGWQAETGKLPLHAGWYRSLTSSSFHFIHTHPFIAGGTIHHPGFETPHCFLRGVNEM